MTTLNDKKRALITTGNTTDSSVPELPSKSVERVESHDAAKRVRMTLEFSAQLNNTIEWLATQLDLKSKTDVIKRAVTLLAFVLSHKNKGKLAIVDENDKVVTLIALM